MSEVGIEREIGLNDRYLRIWGTPLIAITGVMSFMPFFFQGRWDLFWKYLLASTIYIIITWEICRWVLIRIRQLIPVLEMTTKRLIVTMLCFLVVAGLGNAVTKIILFQLGLKPPALASASFFEWWLINMSSVLFFVVLLSCIYEAMYFFSQYKSAVQKAKQLKKERAQHNLEALKIRVNPHFLFNSLTTLSALISEDAPKAEQFVDNLSKVYRYLLRAGQQKTALLSDELKFAEAYVFLLQNRFQEGAFSLKFQSGEAVKSSPEYEQSIPALSLLNAFEYLVRTQNAPLHIVLGIEASALRIECAHQPKNLSFDLPQNDWQALETGGAKQEIHAGKLTLSIPFTSNSFAA